MRLSDHQLVMAAFEGALDESGFSDLQRRLAVEPDLLALYREHALLHHSLCEEFEGRESIGGTVPQVSRFPRWLWMLLGGFGVAVLAFAGWKFTRAKQKGAPAAAGGIPAQEAEALKPNVAVPAVTMLEDNFDTGAMETGRRPALGASHWRLEKGLPRIADGYLEGSDFEIYFWLPNNVLSAERPILLVTAETVAGSGLPFHTPAWAGFSLYLDLYEVCLFGDSFGPEETWSLDVKRGLVPLAPSPFVAGPRTMTLRYDRRDGTVELHEGSEPGDSPLVRSKLLPGLTFDQIRVAAGPGATLAVTKLSIRAMHGDARR